MSMSLFLGRMHFLHPALPLNRSIPLATSNAPTQASSPDPNFAVEYLVQSCGLSSGEARKASKYLEHLKSPDKPDTVLRFLREIGISESSIKAAVSRESRILCSDVEKNVRPNIARLQELGFSIEDISGFFAQYPRLFRFNIVTKLDIWLEALGSVEYLMVVLKSRPTVLESSIENVIMPNLSFLKEQCGLSVRQILRLIKSCPRLITNKTEVVKQKVEEADKLGIDRSSGTFVHALIVVSFLGQQIVDTRLKSLRNLGFSQEEVAIMIRKCPFLLGKSEKAVGRTMEFLIKEAGCDKFDVIPNPTLLLYSLENRLIPRNIVRKLLISEGILGENKAFISVVTPTETQFVDTFILPYEDVIPGLHRTYADASPGNKVEMGEKFR